MAAYDGSDGGVMYSLEVSKCPLRRPWRLPLEQVEFILTVKAFVRNP